MQSSHRSKGKLFGQVEFLVQILGGYSVMVSFNLNTHIKEVTNRIIE